MSASISLPADGRAAAASAVLPRGVRARRRSASPPPGAPCPAARRAVAIVTALLAFLSVAPAARAHELSMAEMQLREVAPAEFVWSWTASEKGAVADDLVPRWPEGCVAEAQRLRCGADGLSGAFSIDGVGKRYSAALVRIGWLDGGERVLTLTAGQPSAQLHGAAVDPRGGWAIAAAYFGLGVEHILSGVDHLLFVVGLLFLVGFGRRLVATITAFTLAHSLTLASSALGWLTLRPPPVEAAIALSIVLVAAEALGARGRFAGAGAGAGAASGAGAAAVVDPPPSLAQRWPALVAFLFGLVHGLGFAGALKEIGLPANHLPVALATFNLGVEAGQLLTVAVAFGGWQLARRWPRAQALRTAALYGIGSVAAYWSWDRVAAIVG